MVRLSTCIDTVNDIIWAPLSHQLTMSVNLKSLQSGQTLPDACAMITEQEATIPAYSKSVSVRLNMRPGQTLNRKLSFFQPSRTFLKLGLTMEAGTSDECNDTITFTKPHEIIAITLILLVSREVTDDTHLTVYAVSTQPVTESPTQVTIEVPKPLRLTLLQKKPMPGSTQFKQILSEVDALHNGVDRQGLKEVLHKYKDSFAKDSLDCGLTNIHTMRIPTNPNAPPTFVRQYKIPIASYEPVQQIVGSMLEKGVIRLCNSTYPAPIWPVLKPYGKWWPIINYRKLNQQVPLSRWPMTQLDQEIPKIKGSTILSTLDVAFGF